MRAYIEKFKAKIPELAGPNMDLYEFTYSDNDGHFWSVMEHGGIFNNVKHWVRSNH
jgi:hypothetical protein